MEEFIDIPGSGRVRLATQNDVARASEARALSIRPARRAVTASAARLTGRGDSAYSRRLSLPWQYRALAYYDQIGELHFASHFLARMMSRVRYFPALLTENGVLKPILEGLPVELLNKIQDPGGGRSRIQYSYGLLSFITGEGVLFGYRLDTPLPRWKFLWKDEVKVFEDGTAVRLYPDKRESDETGIGYRFWTPHPRQSDLADSPVASVMDICEELLILTASVRGTAVSRMTNGIITLPTELSFGAAEAIGDEDMQADPFLEDYAEHVEHQIENPGDASAKVPFALIGAYDYLDRVGWIKTHDPATDYMEKDLRTEAIKRMALGLDMPPEALLGMTDANHWTAKQVMHDMWRSHGIPKAEQFADDLSEAYLRPSLEENEYPNWDSVVVAYDDSQVVISPDRTEDADKALDRIAISYKAYRELKGFDESMAPSEEEKEFLASLKLRQPVELENGDLVIPQRGPVAQLNGNQDAAEGPPAPSQGRSVSRPESRTASAEIIGAAKMALRRCREKAGARLRSFQHDCPECKEATDGESNALVASLLGAEQVVKLGVRDPMKLVQGGADGLKEMLIDSGCDAIQATSLAQMIEVYAARTLFDRHPSLPSGFVASVEKAQEMSHAVEHPA